MSSKNKFSLFNTFKKQLKQKGMDLNNIGLSAEKSAIVDKLKGNSDGIEPVTYKHASTVHMHAQKLS